MSLSTDGSLARILDVSEDQIGDWEEQARTDLKEVSGYSVRVVRDLEGALSAWSFSGDVTQLVNSRVFFLSELVDYRMGCLPETGNALVTSLMLSKFPSPATQRSRSNSELVFFDDSDCSNIEGTQYFSSFASKKSFIHAVQTYLKLNDFQDSSDAVPRYHFLDVVTRAFAPLSPEELVCAMEEPHLFSKTSIPKLDFGDPLSKRLMYPCIDAFTILPRPYRDLRLLNGIVKFAYINPPNLDEAYLRTLVHESFLDKGIQSSFLDMVVSDGSFMRSNSLKRLGLLVEDLASQPDYFLLWDSAWNSYKEHFFDASSGISMHSLSLPLFSCLSDFAWEHAFARKSVLKTKGSSDDLVKALKVKASRYGLLSTFVDYNYLNQNAYK